jgi:uncharacterized protein (DUF1015 family)
MIKKGNYVLDDEARFYIYSDSKTLGLVGAASVRDFETGKIKIEQNLDSHSVAYHTKYIDTVSANARLVQMKYENQIDEFLTPLVKGKKPFISVHNSSIYCVDSKYNQAISGYLKEIKELDVVHGHEIVQACA